MLIAASAAYFLFFKDKSDDSGPNQTNNTSNEPEETPTSIRMLATGDWIAHDSVNAQAETENGGYDYSQFLTAFKPYFDDSDINFCNQATLAGGEEFGISGYPVFNAPLEWIHDMKSFGCNTINTGTNHTNDKGQGPITAQLDEWDKQDPFAHAGSNRSTDEQKKVRYLEVHGVKFALLSYSTYSNSPNPNPYSLNRFDPKLYEPQMKEAREKADIVIVSMRWGTEYSSAVNESQNADAQKLANLGADIVLGHGPHFLEPVKKLKGKDGRETIVWFSLGNFLNTQVETEALTGCVAQFDIDVATKKVTQNMCLPFYMHYEWTAEEKKAEDLLARHNLQILPLFNAQELMAQSQLGTTVDEQMDRIEGIVNTYTKIPVQNATDL